jgi:hypothetical protein
MIGIRNIPFFFRAVAPADASTGLSVWSGTDRPALRQQTTAAMDLAEARCACDLALAGNGGVYNEEAFRYLLEVERRRFERSTRPFALALIEVESQRGWPESMGLEVSALVFDGLASSLRETDVVGWYRDGRTVGAILTHLGEGAGGDVSGMAKRMTQTLRQRVPQVGERLRVRLYESEEILRS